MRRPFRRAFTMIELPVVRHRKRYAFTMIELLVVIGILVLLISILLPAISKAYNEARRNSDAADLAAISQALDAYRNDFGDYPRTDAPLATGQPYPGAAVLCWALVAPGPMLPPPNPPNRQITGADGFDGPGFRVRGTQGTVHQSYLNLDRFKLGMTGAGGVVSVPANGAFLDGQAVILDRFGHLILYFPANTAANPSAPNGYVAQVPLAVGQSQSQLPRFNASDNQNPAPTDPTRGITLAQLRTLLGDTNGNGQIDQGETPITQPFVLISAGPDGQFGSKDDVTNLP